MNLKKGLAVILFFCLSNFAFGQNQYNVEFNEVKGVLKSSDKYKKDFGRYYGYEFPLYEGEKANFAVFSSEFDARLILVDPKGKVHKQSGEARNGIAAILTEVPMSGDWILYVVGNRTDTGQFALRYAVAAANSANLNQNMDLCSSLNFLIAHASARFMMLSLDQLEKSSTELVGDEGKCEIDEKNGSLKITIYEGADQKNAEMSYFSTLSKIENCIGYWDKRELSETSENASRRLQGKVFAEIGNKDGAKILVEFLNEREGTNYNSTNYRVLITIEYML